jgi:hypothetical protein
VLARVPRGGRAARRQHCALHAQDAAGPTPGRAQAQLRLALGLRPRPGLGLELGGAG